MKIVTGVLLVGVVILLVGCSEKSEENVITGKWQGSITERGNSILVELNLVPEEGSIKGTLSILSETGQDIDKGMSLEIVRVQQSNEKIEFIVPVAGEVDDDALAFELLLDGNRMIGHGREMREGSENFPITFVRVEQTVEK